METFKVLGKLKRRELCFGVNNVRGLNNREERILQTSLGSLERERKKTLVHIQTEVKEIQNDLKETTNIWKGELDSKGSNSCSPRCRKIASALVHTRPNSNMQNADQDICDKLADEEVQATLTKTNCWIEDSAIKPRDIVKRERPCTPTSNIKGEGKNTINGVNSTGPRNTSTGSIPVSLQRQVVEHNLRKPASHSDIHSAAKSPGLLRRRTRSTTEHGFQPIAFAHSPRLLRRHRESSSVENIRCTSVSPVGEDSGIWSPLTPHRKITLDFGTLTVHSGNTSPLDSSITSPRRKVPLSRVHSQPILYGPRNTPSPVNKSYQKHVSFSPETKRAVSRKISCPILSSKSQEKEVLSLASLSGSMKTLSHTSTELPDVNDPQDRAALHNETCLRVSPVNSSWLLPDKELQSRVNAFLDTLQTEDAELEEGPE